MKCITVLYPAKDNDAFDQAFYLARHVPLIRDILGKSLHRLEVRRGQPAPDGTPPMYTAVISIWIADWAAYEKAMAVRAKELIDEVPLFTKAMPVIQTDEVCYSNTGG
ncbi:MAG TPA: EthD family reductase [Steroidobacteraceae bacterium]